MSVNTKEKRRLREMSRGEVLRVVREILATYREGREDGWITVDVRRGKAIWVRPAITEVRVPGDSLGEQEALSEFGNVLHDFQAMRRSGTVTLVICGGVGVAVTKVVELGKRRVG